MKTIYQKILQVVGGDCTPVELDMQLFAYAPRSLLDLLDVCGGHELSTAYNLILPPKEWFQVGTSMVFARGSQGEMLWSTPTNSERVEDSAVFCHVRCGDGWETYEENASCFEFLKGFLIWNAIFGLRDPVSLHFRIPKDPPLRLPSNWRMASEWEDATFFLSESAVGCLMTIHDKKGNEATASDGSMTWHKFSLTARSESVCRSAAEEITCLRYAMQE